MTKKEKLAHQLADHAARVNDDEHVILKGKNKEYWLHIADAIIREEATLLEYKP